MAITTTLTQAIAAAGGHIFGIVSAHEGVIALFPREQAIDCTTGGWTPARLGPPEQRLTLAWPGLLRVLLA